MSLQLRTLSFDANDPLRLANFWADALGWEIREGAAGSIQLSPTDGTRFSITFLPADLAQKQDKNRLHLDLTTTSKDDQTGSVERLVALGGRHIDIGQRSDEPHVVLADPEGNEFCVIEPENAFLAGCDRLGSITCDGTRKVGYFWSEALEWPLVWDENEETAIRAPDGKGPFITWGPPVPPKREKNRLHLEFALSPGDDASVEIDRLVALGAKHGDAGQDVGGNVAMLDPDGNEFYVLISG